MYSTLTYGSKAAAIAAANKAFAAEAQVQRQATRRLANDGASVATVLA